MAFRLAWLARVVGDWSEGEVAALSEGLSRFADAVTEVGAPGPRCHVKISASVADPSRVRCPRARSA